MRSIPIISIIFLTILFSSESRAQSAARGPEPILVDEFGQSARANKSRRITVVRTPVNSAVKSAVDVERLAFDLLNDERAAKGLAPLVWNDQIAEIARMHSRNMANERFFSHRGSDGSMVDDRAEVFGISKWRAIGENIAFLQGYDDPAAIAVKKWMESPSHKKNVLNANWSESAVGVVVTPDGEYYFTQVFLLR